MWQPRVEQAPSRPPHPPPGHLNLKLSSAAGTRLIGAAGKRSLPTIHYFSLLIGFKIGSEKPISGSTSPSSAQPSGFGGSLCASVSQPGGQSALPGRCEPARPPAGGGRRARAEPLRRPPSCRRPAPDALRRGGGWSQGSARAPSSAETSAGRRRGGPEVNVRPLPAATELPALGEAASSAAPGLSLPAESASGSDAPGKSRPSQRALTRGLCRPHPQLPTSLHSWQSLQLGVYSWRGLSS